MAEVSTEMILEVTGKLLAVLIGRGQCSWKILPQLRESASSPAT